MSVTHVAGPFAIYKGRGIQRCVICGEKLIDTKGIICLKEGTAFAAWPQGQLVRIEGKEATEWSGVGVFGTDPVPRDFCISMVEM